MVAESLLISFMYLCLHIAVVLLVAVGIVWLFRIMGVALDGQVYFIGKIIVVIIIGILVVRWLFGVIPL